MKKMVSLVACACMASGASAANIYSNDFNDGTASGFVVTGAQGGANAAGVVSFDNNVHSFIGILTQGATATLSLSGLLAGSTLNLSFDIYGFHSLDSDNPSTPGGDFFDLFAGSDRIVHDEYGFVTCANGCYGTTPVPGEVPTSGSFVSEDPDGFGSGNYFIGVRTYHYNLSLANAPSALTLSFVGAANQGWSDEGFGLDNVVITSQDATSAAPEPASWAMMLAGFGAIGCAIRRRARYQVRAFIQA